jgi:predicted Zn-dependent peptidase
MGGLVPALTQETLDNQREVVKNERRQRYENVPYGDAWLRMLPLLYPPGHPYHHSTIGSMEDLNAAALETFQAFHRQYYAPNNCVLTVAGDASPAEVFALAEKYFGVIEPVSAIPPAPFGHLAGPATEPRRETVTGAVPAARIYQVHRTYAFGTAGYDAITVLATVLGNGRGSRLYQRLADGKRIAQPDYIGSYGVDLAHAPAPLIITATAKDGVSAEELEEGLSEVVGSLITEPVTEEELARAKALLTTAWWRQMSTVYGRADTLGRYTTQFGDPSTAAYRLPQWLAVTADDVTEAAAYTLKPESRVTLTYLPEEKP